MSPKQPAAEITVTDRLRKLKREFRKTCTLVDLFEDTASIQNYRRLEAVRELRSECRPSDPLLTMRVRALDGNTVACREGTTDVSVLEDTFLGLYHLPPANLKPVRSILDLGSNIGLTIAHYATLYPEARILGIEMDRDNYDLCERNIRPYSSRCDLLWGAAWYCDGTVAYAGETEWGYQVSENGSRPVAAYSMTSLLDRLGTREVDLVKMDIEGAESAVLQADLSWVERCRCLKVEIHAPYTVQQCIEDLAKAGVRCEIDTRHHASIIAWPGAARGCDVALQEYASQLER